MMRTRIPPGVSVLALVVGVFATEGRCQTTVRVSVDSTGGESNGSSRYPSMSDDGNRVVFESNASNLVPGDTNGAPDVFLRDLSTGTTTRVSEDSLGAEAHGQSVQPSISADGRFVSFTSYAPDLVSGDTNGVQDVFVRDLLDATTTRVSVNSSGVEGNSTSGNWFSSLSADGRFVAFASDATNLVSGDTNGIPDTFVHDRLTGETTRVSVSSTGAQTTNGYSFIPWLSADGRYVTFQSVSTDLVPDDTNGLGDVFVHDRDSQVTTRVSVSTSGAQANGDCGIASISGDGRFVTFTSNSTSLTPQSGNRYNVFVHDAMTGETATCSVGRAGAQSDGDSYWSAISPSGRYVAFHSWADNLVDGDANHARDTFLYDRPAATTEFASVDSSGQRSNGSSGFDYSRPSISRRGRSVAFESVASNLVPDDHNSVMDVFVRTFRRTRVESVLPTAGTEAGGERVYVLGDGFADIAHTTVRFGSTPAMLLAIESDRIAVTTPPGVDTVDIVVSDDNSTATLPAAYTFVAPALAARVGNVNAGRGDRENVLSLNAVSGDPTTREVALTVNRSITVVMSTPSSRSSAKFALYAWQGEPTAATLTLLPRGLGSLVFPAPFVSAVPQPAVIWNNIGHNSTLGAPSLASSSAPSLVFRRQRGAQRPAVATFQGLIEDSASQIPEGVSVTNAIVLRIVP
ncbi:MAG: IPT/TIG domain-containing protein [Planctomycetes bacterium]|nr:IPT/TIG domain-containing protein [Planctomycetota bacterium]